MSDDAAPHEARSGPGYETEDVDIGRAWWITAGLAATVVLIIAGLWGLLHAFSAGQRESFPPLTRQQTAPVRPPAPNLQPAPYADIDAYHREQKAALSGYAYTDAARTRARIPIERAMALTAGQSLDP